MIRLATEADLAGLRDIERAAGRAFADIGMAAIAADEPPTLEVLRHYRRNGRAWVYLRTAPVAYLLARWADGAVHVEQVSVHPDQAGHGIGRALIEHVAGWARERGARALTLTTFAEVAWNAPYYERRCGFRRLRDDELGPELRDIRAAEAGHGLDRWPRVAMRRDLEP
ncbi:GNAT family N-acetyltransferase [Jidongwangia harbinensis]|uniref:GNAT family N-acetyltransferase n=1 Tax=Jidongwangia harbinensis TaxID=2878561 RepID=UPI001CD9825F|nr:GNAT family N-acetyltransferase [Jidongwangia harbinensis]MCA2214449.1 GNAT family N-acetyltransferase [Jidongwangia harbinensis]